MNTINGIVSNVRLEITENSCMIFNLDINLGSNKHITFGNINIGYPDNEIKYSSQEKQILNYCAYYISKVFRVLGVNKMEDIINKPIRVIINDNRCIGIQNFIDNSNYFVPEADFNNIDLNSIL